MAFGFIEPHYVVQQECEIEVDGQRQRMQIRATVVNLSWSALDNAKPASLRASPRRHEKYIALEAPGTESDPGMDVLLHYSSGGDRLMADWSRLTTDPQVDIEDLTGWTEKIEDHSAGYGRNGSISMY